MDGRSLAEQGGQEHKREAEMGRKRAREGERERGRMDVAYFPGDMLFSTAPLPPSESKSLILITVAGPRFPRHLPISPRKGAGSSTEPINMTRKGAGRNQISTKATFCQRPTLISKV